MEIEPLLSFLIAASRKDGRFDIPWKELTALFKKKTLEVVKIGIYSSSIPYFPHETARSVRCADEIF